MNYLKDFFSQDSLFYINPIRAEFTDKVLLFVACGILVLAIVAKIWERVSKNKVTSNLAHRFAKLFATIGLSGVVWYGANYQRVTFFGYRFTFLLILVIGLIWLFYIVKYMFKAYGSEKLAWEKDQLKQKYLK